MTGSLVQSMDADSEVRAAFDAWWTRCGYTPPDDTDDKDCWDAYHVRYGLAWMGFSAGWRAGRLDGEK